MMDPDSTTRPDSDDDEETHLFFMLEQRGYPRAMLEEMRRHKRIRRLSPYDMKQLYLMELGPSRLEHDGSSGYSSQGSGESVYGLGVIPQSQPLDERQVRNSAGGYVHEVDDIVRLRRLMCLGTESPTYYVTQQELTKDNMACVFRLLEKNRGGDVVEELLLFSGRVAKQNALLLVLACVARQGNDLKAKRAAYKSLPKLCGTPTQLFMFLEYCRNLQDGTKGWGRAHRKGVADWYMNYNDNPQKLAMHVTKYRQRNGWAHRDVLRLCHPKPTKGGVSDGLALVLKYVVKGLDAVKQAYMPQEVNDVEMQDTAEAEPDESGEKEEERTMDVTDIEKNENPSAAVPTNDEKSQHTDVEMAENKETTITANTDETGAVTDEKEKKKDRPKKKNQVKKLVQYLDATEEARNLPKDQLDRACALIKKHNLVREHFQTELLNLVPMWQALLKKMPLTAMIRNLGKMTKEEMFCTDNDDLKIVVDKLTNPEVLKYAKIHPFNVLVAQKVYQSGHGDKGGLSWIPNQKIVQSLEECYYKSFKYVEPTKKRLCIALDISGSMGSGCVHGCNMLIPRQAAAAMAMVTVRTEPNIEIVGFSGDLVKLSITAEMTLDQVNSEMTRYPFGNTDCAKPMIWAMKQRKQFDAFIIYTDSETWCGGMHVTEAIKRYRESSLIRNAKVIVVAMTSTGFTIADPNDRFMLDVSGFDSSVPEILHNFILGKI